jgi:hypothetical protein
MLRARAISNAARAYCPEILTGCYTVGELTEARAVVVDEPPAPTAPQPEPEIFDVEVEEVDAVEAQKLDSGTRGKLLAWMGKAKVKPDQVAQWVGVPWFSWTEETAAALRDALKADAAATIAEIQNMEHT